MSLVNELAAGHKMLKVGDVSRENAHEMVEGKQKLKHILEDDREIRFEHHKIHKLG